MKETGILRKLFLFKIMIQQYKLAVSSLTISAVKRPFVNLLYQNMYTYISLWTHLFLSFFLLI